MTREHYFGRKGERFSDTAILRQRSMRIWTIKNADKIRRHMSAFIRETFINRMGGDSMMIDPSLLVITDVQRSEQEKPVSHCLPSLQELDAPGYETVQGTVAIVPHEWNGVSIEGFSEGHIFFTDRSGEHIVDLTIAQFVAGHPDFQPGDRWKVLADRFPDLVYECSANREGFYALMGPKDKIRSELGVEFQIK